MRRLASLAILGTIAITTSLTACIGEPDGLRVPVPIGGGGSYAPAQPNNAPMAPPDATGGDLPSQPRTIQGERWSPVTEPREWHAAATPGSCFDIEARFQREGRKVHLADTKLTGDPSLPFACVFEGEDADPEYVIPPYWR